jgi:hypothetical protein
VHGILDGEGHVLRQLGELSEEREVLRALWDDLGTVLRVARANPDLAVVV